MVGNSSLDPGLGLPGSGLVTVGGGKLMVGAFASGMIAVGGVNPRVGGAGIPLVGGSASKAGTTGIVNSGI